MVEYDNQNIKSEYNAALRTVNEVAGWLFLANEAIGDADSFSAFSNLEKTRRKLSAFMNKQEILQAEEYRDKTKSYLDKHNSQRAEVQRLDWAFYLLLDAYYIFLSNIANNKGMLLKEKFDMLEPEFTDMETG